MLSQSEPQSFKDFERSGWNRNAAGYDARAGQMTTKAIEPMLEAVQAGLGMRLLDVCCGPGYGAGAAAARGLEAVGVDIAPAMIDEAKQRFPAATFLAGDAEALDFPDSSFDAVICAFGLLHVPHPEQAIAEAFRVLKAGGRYAWTVWCGPEKTRLLKLALDAIAAHADMTAALPAAPPMFQYADPGAAAAALVKAGFDGPTSTELPIAFHGRSPDDVFDWFDKGTVRTMALFRLQEPEVQARIRDAILEGARAYVRDGRIDIPCPALLHQAIKPS
jgi:ubiquinone/menaquinone biosynthesis C-methylase UbiE